jgi:hypothetical protein
MVQTPNGLKAIETFKPGDLVYSKDQYTQAPGVRPVVGTKQTLDQLLYEVVVQNAQGQTETYTTTSEHPFWVTNGPANGQWLKASLLQAGLHLTNAHGETLEVVSQTALEQTATVYNIQVHGHSTYHVGEMGVWVHNADCCNLIPNSLEAKIDPKKIVNYVLDKEHPVGGHKAKVFESALGFNQTNSDLLIKNIQEGVLKFPAVKGAQDKFGQKFTIDMPIVGPNGNTAVVRTGWIFDVGSNTPRLVTLFVK